ncbi:NAD(P)/FAD-dependent oxidoreductase [Actinacidiphila sp. bgisy160]|uniref:NAD(P)/FAD-dependent oxidoreductase n=1 Tax=Actinacidiphila sp. bgisy160 TaxID=3413796 RepID=UPI003D72576E
MTTTPHNIVIVGASLAGLRVGQALRAGGHQGPLTLIGAEPHPPYDRPPLSKEFLFGHAGPEALTLESTKPLGLTERYGQCAVHLDTTTHEIHLDDGSVIPYDGLVITTGAGARTWPDSVPTTGVHTIRTLRDAQNLRNDLAADQRHILIAGSGFIGCEVASVATQLGHRVTLVGSQPLPLHNTVGAKAASFLTQLHHDSGVTVITNASVTSLHGTHRLTGATIADNTGTSQHITADTALLALGARPHTDWLTTSGLQLHNGGLTTDEYTRTLSTDGTPLPHIVAAGDVTRFPHPHAPTRISLGHWSNAVEQAQIAAHNLLNPHHPTPYHPVASFWSTQYAVRFRAVGLPHYADHTEVREFDPTHRRLDVAYYRNGHLIGALTANRAARITAYRTQLAEHLATQTHP